MPVLFRKLREVLMRRQLLFVVVLLASGCLPTEEGSTQIAYNPFGTPPPPPQQRTVSYSPASAELCERVDFIGRTILAANNQIGLKPYFATIGSPSVEIFHKDASMVYVTAGLVNKCASEADLAAVLSLELGKMVAEREAMTPRQTRQPDVPPPIQMPIGNDRYPGNTDLTHLAEQGKYENAHPRKPRRLPPPDPAVLARGYLHNAGYPKEQLDAVAPVLQAAEHNFDLERQFRGIPPGNWTP
jgi:hypothetical protein